MSEVIINRVARPWLYSIILSVLWFFMPAFILFGTLLFTFVPIEVIKVVGFCLFLICAVIAWFWMLAIIWGTCFTKTIIASEQLEIRTPFKKYEFLWSDINEFGKREIIRMSEAGDSLSNWDCYFKISKWPQKTFIVANDEVKNAAALIDLVFRNAHQAKFITYTRYAFQWGYKKREWYH